MKTKLPSQSNSHEKSSVFSAVPPATPASLPQAETLREKIGQVVQLEGMVYRVRRMSGFAFVTLRAGNQLFQCVYEREQADFPLSLLEEEAVVRLWGLVRQEPRSRVGFEILLRRCQRLSGPTSPLPASVSGKKLDLGLETLLDLRPLTLRRMEQQAIFRIQAALCQGIREFLQAHEFTEIHTPKIAASGAEGGSTLFELNYFGKSAYLAQSPQCYKQAMVGVFPRVYEIGPVFRAEKHNTSRHLNEYVGVDLEMGFLNHYSQLMELETALLQSVFVRLRQLCPEELGLLGVEIPEIGQIPALSFEEAKALLARHGLNRPGSLDLEPQEEKLLCQLSAEETGCELLFVTGHPAAKRPFYAMETPERPEYTESFDLLFRGLEITTGGQRIHEYSAQVEKMERMGLNPADFSSYLAAHRHGLPPHGGLGLGLERLTARLLALPNLRQASLFPRDQQRLTP